MKMRSPSEALWPLSFAAACFALPATAISPAPIPSVICEPGSGTIEASQDKILRSAAEIFWRRITQARVKLSAYADLPEASEAALAVSIACAYSVKGRLIELGVPSDRIDVLGVTVAPGMLRPGYTVVLIN